MRREAIDIKKSFLGGVGQDSHEDKDLHVATDVR